MQVLTIRAAGFTATVDASVQKQKPAVFGGLHARKRTLGLVRLREPVVARMVGAAGFEPATS